MAEMKVTIRDAELKKLAVTSTVRSATNAAIKTQGRARAVLRNGGHNRTGRLSDSIEYRVVRKAHTGCQITVGSRLHYAGYVENGRGWVYPKKAKALRFVINGKVIYAKKARPSKPVRYLAKAFSRMKASDFSV